MTTSHDARAARGASGEFVCPSLIPGEEEEEEGKEDGSAMNMDAVAAALEAVVRVPLSPTGRSSSSSSTRSSSSTSSTSTSTSISSGIPTSEIAAASSSLTTETTTTTATPFSFASATHTTTTTTTTTTTSTPFTLPSSLPLPPVINPRRLSGAGSHENFSPQVIQRLAREVRELMTSPPEGVSFVPNDEETLMEIHVDMQGPVGTPYEEGAFRLKLVLSRNYPHSPPRAFFLTKIYHPNVAWGGGDVCVDVLKRSWSADITLGHTLQVIRCLLIVPFPESSLNDEAGRLFMQGYEEYARRAKLYTTVHAKVLLPAVPASPKHDCNKASAAEAGGREAATDSGARKVFSAKGGSSSLSLSAAMGAGGDKSGGDNGEGEEKGVASKITQQQRSKDARRKSLKRL